MHMYIYIYTYIYIHAEITLCLVNVQFPMDLLKMISFSEIDCLGNVFRDYVLLFWFLQQIQVLLYPSISHYIDIHAYPLYPLSFRWSRATNVTVDPYIPCSKAGFFQDLAEDCDVQICAASAEPAEPAEPELADEARGGRRLCHLAPWWQFMDTYDK